MVLTTCKPVVPGHRCGIVAARGSRLDHKTGIACHRCGIVAAGGSRLHHTTGIPGHGCGLVAAGGSRLDHTTWIPGHRCGIAAAGGSRLDHKTGIPGHRCGIVPTPVALDVRDHHRDVVLCIARAVAVSVMHARNHIGRLRTAPGWPPDLQRTDAAALQRRCTLHSSLNAT